MGAIKTEIKRDRVREGDLELVCILCMEYNCVNVTFLTNVICGLRSHIIFISKIV